MVQKFFELDRTSKRAANYTLNRRVRKASISY